MIIPPKLRSNDTIAIIAPSRSLGGLYRKGYAPEEFEAALKTIASLGLQPRPGKHLLECDNALSSAVESRLADLEAAAEDPAVRGAFCLAGGMNAIQLLRQLDFGRIAATPKILCGYSDGGTLLNAIFARTGIVGYYGPNVAGLATTFGREEALAGLHRCLLENEPYEISSALAWSPDGEEVLQGTGPWCLHPGEAEGRLIGGGLHCLSSLQGTPFFPPLDGAILLLKSPWAHKKATLAMIDAALDSLIYQPGFDGVRALAFGRFLPAARVTRESLGAMIRSKPELRGLPVVANLDFGHTLPRATVPIGGTGRIIAAPDRASLLVLEH